MLVELDGLHRHLGDKGHLGTRDRRLPLIEGRQLSSNTATFIILNPQPACTGLGFIALENDSQLLQV